MLVAGICTYMSELSSAQTVMPFEHILATQYKYV